MSDTDKEAVERGLSVDTARRLLTYDQDTGELYWRPRTAIDHPGWDAWRITCWNNQFAGKRALTSIADGYRNGSILGVTFKAQRVIWAIQNGEWPQGVVDHINGDRCDNRIGNLRCITQTENKRNCRYTPKGRCHVPGVHWKSDRKKWQVRIGGKKGRYVGIYPCIGVAIRARKEAQVLAGYSADHGKLTHTSPTESNND